MRFSKLAISEFRHFSDTEVILGKYMTVIAGFNGTGKSTLLGILANASELKKYRTYAEKPYRGEFSELFKASKSHDPSGQKMFLSYLSKDADEGSLETVAFRTTWQKYRDNDRFRIIPKRKLANGSTTESKLSSPVIYLGLSRLYPLGETSDEALKESRQKWDHPDDEKWFTDKYKKILMMRENLVSVSKFGISGESKKAGVGIDTDHYAAISNSAGQDNLGQILLAALSFRKLKRELKDDWDGGLLIIDELDATLHGAAQTELVNILFREAKSVGFQIVFTTHSPTILEEMAKKCAHNIEGKTNDIEICYLTDANRKLEVIQNPTWNFMESDLLVTGGKSLEIRVGVFSEDAEAAWFAEEVLKVLHPALLPQISFIDVSFGCKTLMHLYVHDFLYLKNRIVMFDGDVAEEDIVDTIPESLTETGKNIVRLPGNRSPEQVLYEYLLNLDGSHTLLKELRQFNITLRSLEANGPLSGRYQGDDREKHKSWFKENKSVFDSVRLIECWVQDNLDEACRFVENFSAAYNAVASRTTAPNVPMAKLP